MCVCVCVCVWIKKRHVIQSYHLHTNKHFHINTQDKKNLHFKPFQSWTSLSSVVIIKILTLKWNHYIVFPLSWPLKMLHMQATWGNYSVESGFALAFTSGHVFKKKCFGSHFIGTEWRHYATFHTPTRCGLGIRLSPTKVHKEI